MERPHYRRVSGGRPSNGAKQAGPGKHSTFSERLVAQFIICGVILALILVLNLFDTPLTHNLKGIIQDQTTADDVKQAFSDASNTVKTIFGNTYNGADINSLDMANTSTSAAAISDSPTPAPRPAAADTAAAKATTAASPAPEDFRIDEDMLTKIEADSAKQ